MTLMVPRLEPKENLWEVHAPDAEKQNCRLQHAQMHWSMSGRRSPLKHRPSSHQEHAKLTENLWDNLIWNPAVKESIQFPLISVILFNIRQQRLSTLTFHSFVFLSSIHTRRHGCVNVCIFKCYTD